MRTYNVAFLNFPSPFLVLSKCYWRNLQVFPHWNQYFLRNTFTDKITDHISSLIAQSSNKEPKALKLSFIFPLKIKLRLPPPCKIQKSTFFSLQFASLLDHLLGIPKDFVLFILSLFFIV